MSEEPITLKEVQLRLGVPQHVLIHLCEKGVIEPDFAETSGRGKRREFSEGNVFEFALALALRRFEVPVATTALVLRVLRSFMRAVTRAAPGFELPGSLLRSTVSLALYFYDGESLVLSAQGGGLPRPLLLRARFPLTSRAASLQVRIEKVSELPKNYDTRLEVNLTRIARRVFQ